MNNIKIASLIILVACVLLYGCEKPTERVYAYKDNILINDCWFKSEVDWPVTICGALKVPENYNQPEGRQLELPFIIVKSREPDIQAYPLVVAGGGGPGGGLGISRGDVDNFDGSMWEPWSYSTINAGRDLILIDNRGVGSSVPKLDCPEVEDAVLKTLGQVLDRDQLIKLTKKAYGACRQRLVQQGIDISQYHVVNAAKDLEQLRIALGVDQINVYGISYGTRVSLVFERFYPGSVRTMILDGVTPLSGKFHEDSPRLNSLAMTRLIKKCEEDFNCQVSFGHNLAERLSTYLEKLDESPITVNVTSPVDYESIEVIVTPDMLFDTIYSSLYDGSMIAYIPKYLYTMLKGNTDYLAELVRDYYVVLMTTDSLDEGAYASYSCFDEVPFTDFEVARNEVKKYPFQHYSNVSFFDYAQAMCDVWDVPAAAADFKEPYSINTPVLIYSGELDPVTPLEMAKPVIDNARMRWVMEWPNISHGVMFVSECADWTAEVFLSNPESDPFVYECSNDKAKYKFIAK